MNDFSFPWLVWNLVHHSETTFTWSYAAFYLPVFVKGYGPFLLAHVGLSLRLWRLTKKRVAMVVKAGGVLQTGRLGFPRYQLQDGDSVVVPDVHTHAAWEADAEAEVKTNAQLRGQKKTPRLPHYYRESLEVFLSNAGQPRKIADIYGKQNAVDFAMRVQWALKKMEKVTDETDWTAYKRKLRGLDQ